MRCRVLLINGPNLNLLGKREKNHYGEDSLDKIVHELEDIALENEIELEHFQSNNEGDIVTYIQQNGFKADYLIINPAAYTHTSVAIRDAVLAVNIKTIEVHISNIFKREDFRSNSFISDIAEGVISGLGRFGYNAALYYVIRDFTRK